MLNITLKSNTEHLIVNIPYLYSASKSNPRMNDWESQSLMVLQLPDWVDMRQITVNEEYTLNCDKQWTVFPKMDIDMELEEDKSILFIYNIVLPLVEKHMTIGIYLNNLLEVEYIYNI